MALSSIRVNLEHKTLAAGSEKGKCLQTYQSHTLGEIQVNAMTKIKMLYLDCTDIQLVRNLQ